MDHDETMRFARQVVSTARAVEHALGDVSLTTFRLLTVVAEGNVCSSSVAHCLGVCRSTVTASINGLVDRGLVDRVTDTQDRRTIWLHLTASGAERLAEAEDRVAARFGPVLARVDDGATTAAAFERFYDVLLGDQEGPRRSAETDLGL